MKRELWALDHPNIAGVYFGLFFSLVLAIPAALLESAALGALIVPVVGIPSAMFFAKGIRDENERRRRSGFETPPGFWSRFSDRFLFWMMVVLSVGFIASALDLVIGDENRWRAAGGAALSAAFAVSAGVERHRRRVGRRP